jgi:hypothetical protein
MLALIEARPHQSLLADFPYEVDIRIVEHLAATSKRPMDELRALWACCFMCSVCGEPEVG